MSLKVEYIKFKAKMDNQFYNNKIFKNLKIKLLKLQVKNFS